MHAPVRAKRRHRDRTAHRLGAEAGRRRAAQHLDLLHLLGLERLQFGYRRGEAIDEDGDAAHAAHGDHAVVLVEPDAASQHLDDVGRLLARDVGGGDQRDVSLVTAVGMGQPRRQQQRRPCAPHHHAKSLSRRTSTRSATGASASVVAVRPAAIQPPGRPALPGR